MNELLLCRSDAGILKYEFWERQGSSLRFLLALCAEDFEALVQIEPLNPGESRRVKKIQIELEAHDAQTN